jgi:hypothetical protein
MPKYKLANVDYIPVFWLRVAPSDVLVHNKFVAAGDIVVPDDIVASGDIGVDIGVAAVDIADDIADYIAAWADIAAWVDIAAWDDIAEVAVFARVADNCYSLLLLFYQKSRAIFLWPHRVWPVLTYPKLTTLQKHRPVADAVYPFILKICRNTD